MSSTGRRGWHIRWGDGTIGEHFPPWFFPLLIFAIIFKLCLRWIWTMRSLESQHRHHQWPSRRKDEKKLGLKSAINWFPCLSTHPSCEQTNKQNRQQIIVNAYWRCGATEGTLRAPSPTRCSKSILDNTKVDNGHLIQAMWSGMFWGLPANYSFPQNGLLLTLTRNFWRKL